MRRDLQAISRTVYDVIVVGGGAAGAATAREAALRGLRTLLIEREDFGAGTSAHCFKVVHGGIRYIQHADVARLRASCHERTVLLRVAPHLVKPLPFVVPTYGAGRNSKWLLGAGMKLYDLLTADRNAGQQDEARRIRSTRFLSCDETLALFPDIERRGLTGAAIFEDGQMHNPPRLVLAFVEAAEAMGADVANYVAAERLLVRNGHVCAVAARDTLNGERFEIRTRLVINAAGPWAEGLLDGLSRTVARTPGTYSRDACFLISRKCEAQAALSLQSHSKDADAVVARGGRHLFLVPWRNRTLVGVWHRVVPRDPEAANITRQELGEYVAEINRAYPAFELRESEILRTDFGLVPFGEAERQDGARLSFGKQSRLIDHRRLDSICGLITLISVRYTVARLDAVRALDLACEQLGRGTARARASETMPLPGGDIGRFSDFMREMQRTRPSWLSEPTLESLVMSYGSRTPELIDRASAEPLLRRTIAGSHVLLAEVAWALEKELAQTLADVVFRRTELGTAGHPGGAALDEVTAFMQQARGWTARRAAEERRAVEQKFERFLAAAQVWRQSA